jgi:polar amino acid transport system substrate-binding protein
MAKHRGYYEEAGLDVEFKEWNKSINVVKDVMSEKSTYGVARPGILVDKSQGADVLLIAAIFQSSPLVLLTTKDSGIKELKDIKNKRVMSVKDSSTDVAIRAMLSSKGISFDDLDVIEHSMNVKDLVDGKTDLMTAYVTGQPYKLMQLGKEPLVFNPRDYGFNFYSDILFTSKKEEKLHAKRLENFTEASLKGWEYAFSHIEQSVEYIYNNFNSQNKTRAELLYEARELKKLAYYNTDFIGDLDSKKIDNIIYVYKLMGVIKNDIDIESIIYKQRFKSLLFTKAEKRWIQKNNNVKYSEVNWKPLSIIKDDKMSGIRGD